jgi:fructose-1,6-bisphosphatase/inositol monophosphatase family enzyme
MSKIVMAGLKACHFAHVAKGSMDAWSASLKRHRNSKVAAGLFYVLSANLTMTRISSTHTRATDRRARYPRQRLQRKLRSRFAKVISPWRSSSSRTG